jgi:hypothetical protein
MRALAVVTVFALLVGCTPPAADQTPTQAGSQPVLAQATAAQSCKTLDDTTGSYRQSCHECVVTRNPQHCATGSDACLELECHCNVSLERANGTYIFLRSCTSCQFWNNHGNLQCGDG